MIDPALGLLFQSIAASALAVGLGASALALLPWTDDEIDGAEEAVRSLLRPPPVEADLLPIAARSGRTR